MYGPPGKSGSCKTPPRSASLARPDHDEREGSIEVHTPQVPDDDARASTPLSEHHRHAVPVTFLSSHTRRCHNWHLGERRGVRDAIDACGEALAAEARPGEN